MQEDHLKVTHVAAFSVTSRDAAGLVRFYQSAFGANLLVREQLKGDPFERLLGVRGGAVAYRMQVGGEYVDILQFDHPGEPYPRVSSPYDLVFQHFAIVVNDMGAAYAHLQSVSGWRPLSKAPQRLPPRSGGVVAFKFQDPDGHPLELLCFPEATKPARWLARPDSSLCSGVDHSALSVRDTTASRDFYSALGLEAGEGTVNFGTEQALLDGVSNPHVVVTPLFASRSVPHLELLCYRSHAHRTVCLAASNDVAATRTVLAIETSNRGSAGGARFATDPDGHHMLYVPATARSLKEVYS